MKSIQCWYRPSLLAVLFSIISLPQFAVASESNGFNSIQSDDRIYLLPLLDNRKDKSLSLSPKFESPMGLYKYAIGKKWGSEGLELTLTRFLKNFLQLRIVHVNNVGSEDNYVPSNFSGSFYRESFVKQLGPPNVRWIMVPRIDIFEKVAPRKYKAPVFGIPQTEKGYYHIRLTLTLFDKSNGKMIWNSGRLEGSKSNIWYALRDVVVGSSGIRLAAATRLAAGIRLSDSNDPLLLANLLFDKKRYYEGYRFVDQPFSKEKTIMFGPVLDNRTVIKKSDLDRENAVELIQIELKKRGYRFSDFDGDINYDGMEKSDLTFPGFDFVKSFDDSKADLLLIPWMTTENIADGTRNGFVLYDLKTGQTLFEGWALGDRKFAKKIFSDSRIK